jgi:hypothetical protein
VTPAEIIEQIKPGYLECRELPDGSVACLLELFYTRAIVLGCDEWGFSSRFCFSDRTLATERFRELKSEDDVPEGHIAARGKAEAL